MTLRASVHPGPNLTRILATEEGDDCLKAVLPSRPIHPRALYTLLEGLALWHGLPVHAALVAGDPSALSRVEDLFGGGLWPHDLANVRFEVRHPRRPDRIRGPGDFRQLYLLHGGGR